SRNLADTAAEFSRIVVKQNRDGSIIRVGDIATVLDGFPDNNFIFRIDGKAGVTFELKQPKNDDIVKIMRNVRRWIDERQATLPEGVKLELDFTLEEFYEGRLTLVRDNAAQGLVLVLLVLMLFLRPAVAFWVAVGIAVSFIGTFIFLPIVGVSLNMLSLFGLLLVIGIVVDDALVVGESINRQVELGREGLEAAVLGTQLVLKPVVFAVLTTMLAFSPFLVIGGTFGPFVESIAWTIILALTFSLIESFIILPSHLANLKPPSDIALLRLQRRFADSLLWFAQNYYKPVVTKALEFRSVTITIFLGLMSMAIALVGQGWIPMSFAPNIENNFIQGQITMQDGTAWSRKRQVLERVEQATAELKATLREERGGEIILSASAWANDNSSAINSFINLAEADIAGIGSNEISERLRDLIGPIPDAVEIRLDTSAGQDSGGFTVGVKSSDREQSRRATEEIKAYLRGVPQLFDVRDSMQAPLDELRLKLRPGAERFGVSVNEVSRQLRQAYLGEEIQRLPRGGQDVLVTVRYPLESRQSLKSLFTEFRIRTSDGREIPASAVVEFETGPAVRSIERLDRKRSVAIYARKREGADVGPIKKKFFEEIQPAIQARYPAVSIERRGEDKQQFDFFSTLAFLGGAALLSIYMLLAIAFSSYFQPMLIMSAIPFGFTGAVFGHLLFGVDFSVFSFFGIGAAAGVVVNDNLVLVDYVNRLRAQGAGALAALVEAGTVRFRPILLTSVTTFIGLLPIIFEDSLDAQFLKPVAISLAFGVAFALFVTLLFVPAMYAVGADLSRFITGLVTGKRQPRLGEGASQESLPEILGAGREPSSPNAPAE
ncbi:MAG: efflux RND transporter permease subunit, partial [Pseudomonadota bacterium]